MGWAFPCSAASPASWVLLDAEASPQRLLLGADGWGYCYGFWVNFLSRPHYDLTENQRFYNELIPNGLNSGNRSLLACGEGAGQREDQWP